MFTSLIFIASILTLYSTEEPVGLQLGEQAPNFEAIDQFENVISLKEALESGKVILTFYRGSWCRYCIAQFRNYQDSLSLIAAKGASLIAITPEHEEGINKTVDKTGASFSIIHDEKLRIMLAYDVISQEKVNEYIAGFKKTGDDNQDKYLPVPATYIIDQDGKVTFKYFDPNYQVRVTIKSLLENL